MTITVCVGASGSGKTTFLEDVYKVNHCTYIRQYHMMRPYIEVKKIPNFDPTQLPFWETYEREGVADHIQVGGTLAGKFTQGLSGGQRKLLLFELIYQRTRDLESRLLICLDEPFSGVTDGFVPFIQKRLECLRERHNIVLVTNDHVELLKDIADNVITVSSIDRTVVQLNDREGVDRERMILALTSVGNNYSYDSREAGVKFFWDVEVVSNTNLRQIFVFAIFAFCFYIATFWNSDATSAPLVLIAGGIVAFFSLQPFLLSQVEWRNSMLEETEALVHSSPQLNRLLKLFLTLALIFVLTAAEYGVVNLVIDGMFTEARYWVAMLCDSASLTLPLVCMGIYTRLPFQTVQIVGSLPFLGMLFLSTTFSPGAGLAIIKELRYLYPRFYFWCMVPGVQEGMEGCPSEDIIVLYLVLSAFTGVFVFFSVMFAIQLRSKGKEQRKETQRNNLQDDEFKEIQCGLYRKDSDVLRNGEGVPKEADVSASSTSSSHNSEDMV